MQFRASDYRPTFTIFQLAVFVCGLVIGFSGLPLTLAQMPTADGQSSAVTAVSYNPKDQTLTVHVTSMPLNQLLESITSQTGVRFRTSSAANRFDGRPVTGSFDHLPLEQGIKQLLGPSNTAMLYGEQAATAGQPKRIVLQEVRVVDLDIILVTTTPTAAIAKTIQTSPLPNYDPSVLEEIRANRAEKKAERAAQKDTKGQNREKGGKKWQQGKQNQMSTETDPSTPGAAPEKSSRKSRKQR